MGSNQQKPWKLRAWWPGYGKVRGCLTVYQNSGFSFLEREPVLLQGVSEVKEVQILHLQGLWAAEGRTTQLWAWNRREGGGPDMGWAVRGRAAPQWQCPSGLGM